MFAFLPFCQASFTLTATADGFFKLRGILENTKYQDNYFPVPPIEGLIETFACSTLPDNLGPSEELQIENQVLGLGSKNAIFRGSSKAASEEAKSQEKLEATEKLRVTEVFGEDGSQ
jgi:hypothetical protein